MLQYKEFTGVARLEKAAENNPAIHWGANGPPIATLQRAYVALGFPMPKSTRADGMDGIFGSETYSVTKGFQKKNGLKADGVIGKNTMKTLDAQMVAKTTPKPTPKPKPAPPRPRKPKPVPPPVTVMKFEDRNNYDLYMLKQVRYTIVLTMSITFVFKDGAGASWSSDQEKRNYIFAWREAVTKKWSLPILYNSRKFGGVPFEIRIYAFKENGATVTEWTLTVTKIPSGEFRTSSVTDGNKINTSIGDSEDLVGVNKGASMLQRAAVHEFGHMLGLPDEYPAAVPGGPNVADTDSIMHSGEALRQRHHKEFREWAKAYFGE
jgi:hypothetical protein